MNNPERQAIINGSPHPVGVERSAAITSILQGQEDFTLNIHGKIISSNLEAVNITGYEEWEAIGRHFSIFYTQQDIDAGIPDQDLLKACEVSKFTFSCWRVKKRNITFWAQVTLICLKDPDSHVTGYRMILKDQTHRLVSNNRVRKFRNEYLNLFNNPFIGVFKFRSNDFKIILINEKAGRIIGMGKEPKRFNQIFKSVDAFHVFEHSLNTQGKVNGFEFEVKAETVTWARIDCRLFADEGFVEGVVSDVTESRKQLQELKRLNEELDCFIYHASHDLRSPLTSLLGLINLMEIDDSIGTKEYCLMMRERVTYLDELLRDMTSIVFNNKTEVVAEQVDFNAIVQSLMKEYKRANSAIDITYELKNEDVFFSDSLRIQIILRNLIISSIKHFNPHCAVSFIRISIGIFNETATIKITDNGKGFREGQECQIFDMFYKIGTDAKETGLGLYIVKLMIDKLGGKISVESKLGEGTAFTIELQSQMQSVARLAAV